jgi:hypothetical protein
METQIILIEDTKSTRTRLENRIRQMELFDSVETYKNKADFESNYKLNGYTQVGLFDINLNERLPGNEEGIECCSFLRRLNPAAYIIAYSHLMMLKKKAIEAGANEFFEKDTIDTEETMFEKLYTLSVAHFGFKKSGIAEFNLQYEIMAIISNISEKFILMDCYFEKEKIHFQKRFALSDFSHFKINELNIDTSILISFLKNKHGLVIRDIKISEKDFSDIFEYRDTFKEVPSYSANEIINSTIFKKTSE